MASIFSRIISGEIPAYKIAEDENFFAFLDIHPIVKGHTLVIPKLEVDQLFDLPEDLLGGILLFAQPIAQALKATFHTNRCGLTVMGLEVPHAHIHLLPINKEKDMSFANLKLKLSPEDFLEMQQAIVNRL